MSAKIHDRKNERQEQLPHDRKKSFLDNFIKDYDRDVYRLHLKSKMVLVIFYIILLIVAMIGMIRPMKILW